ITSMPFIPVPGEGLTIGIFIFCPGEACAFGAAAGICMPGIFICVCGAGEGELCGICIFGMFICICCGEGCGAAGFLGDEEGCVGIFIPGMLPIWLLSGDIFAGALFFLDTALRRCTPGIFMPGMLDISCFFAACFFRVVFLFFREVVLKTDFAFRLFIPGMLD